MQAVLRPTACVVARSIRVFAREAATRDPMRAMLFAIVLVAVAGCGKPGGGESKTGAVESNAPAASTTQGGASKAANSAPANLAFKNGAVYTVDGARSWA